MPFIFVGTAESIGNAKILLEYNLDHLRVSTIYMQVFKFSDYTNFRTNIVVLTQKVEKENCKQCLP